MEREKKSTLLVNGGQEIWGSIFEGGMIPHFFSRYFNVINIFSLRIADNNVGIKNAL